MFALKNLLRRKIRTYLSILGVGVGVASIIAFTSIGDGFRATINEAAKATGAHLVVYDSRVADPVASRLTKDDFTALRQVENVEDVAGNSFTPSFMIGLPGLLVISRDPNERLIQSFKNDHLQGRLLATRDEVMLGEIIATKLKKKVGDQIDLFGKKFTIVGIIQTLIGWENGAAIAHVDVVRDALKIPDGASMMGFVFLKDVSKRDETAAAIRAKLPHLRVERPEAMAGSIDQLKYVDAFVWVISIAAILVAAIGVLNTLLMSISERVREIGTLRAFGWSRGRVVKFILVEGLIISALGGIVGVAMGVIGAEVLVRWVPQELISTKYDAFLFVKGMAVAIFVGVIGSTYPAFQASKLAPAEALRYE